MEFNENFFSIALFAGVLAFYGATYLRALVLYIKTKVNHYNFGESRDKGFLLLFIISAVNLFFPQYVKYMGSLSFLLGAFEPNLKIAGAFVMPLSIALLVIAQNSLGSSWKIGLEEERKTRIVKTGMYRYSRHPIYVAMLFFFIGVFLLLPTILTMILFIGNMVALVSTAKKEEEHLIREYGDDYKNYMEEVGFLFPKPSLFRKKDS